jgi:hypothetical protein
MEDLDMVYNINDGKIMAGGYSVNSILLNDQRPAMYQKEGGKSKNEKVSDRFKNLAVPAGLLYINESVSENAKINDAKINDAIINDAIINDDLYEKLLDLAGPQKSEAEKQKSEAETQKSEAEKQKSESKTQKTKKQTRSKKGKNKKRTTKKNNRK